MKKLILFFLIICLNYQASKSQSNSTINGKYLLVLDVQQRTYADAEKERRAKELVQLINSIINKFENKRVIYVKNATKTLNVSLKGFVVDTLPIRPLDSSLNIINTTIFTKYDGDAFTSKELLEFLEKNKIKDIVIVGRIAEECIFKTAMGGKSMGYTIYLAPKAIMGKTDKKKEKAISKMLKKGIRQISFDELIN